MNTSDWSVSPGSPPPPPGPPTGDLGWTPPRPPRRRRGLWAWALVPVALLVLLAIGAAFVRLPYYAIGPGSARPVDDLVKVEGASVYPPGGQVLFTTVSVGPVQNVYQALDGWLDPDTDVIPEERIIPKGQSRDQYRKLNLAEMVDSKSTAEYVALRQLGYDVPVHGEGALVLDVQPGYPATKVLEPGDVIVEADGQPVELSSDLVALIRAHRPGDRIDLKVKTVDTTDPPRPVSVELRARADGTPLLGVSLQTYKQRFDFPLQVTIDSGEVGGPSAGLAFTLTLLDLLTPGELTGGKKVAVTGTIEPDGTVGPIGGVVQKVATVKRAGAQLFIVPSADYKDAIKHAGKLRIVKADTLDEVLHVLGEQVQGSNALALGRPGAAKPPA